MADHDLIHRIAISRDVMHGKPRVAGTRVMVAQVLDLLAGGKTSEEIISDDYYPDLTLEDVRACLAYASQITPYSRFSTHYTSP